MDFELNTPKEIWEAKKTLYESDTATKKSFISSVISLVTKLSIKSLYTIYLLFVF